METLEFILAFFGLMVVWRYVWCRSLLDQARDTLFDLRDELRLKYRERGWDLGSPSYKQARDLVNAHLRFTEDLSFWHIVYLQAGIASNEQLAKSVEEKYVSMFADLPKEQVEFVQGIRRRSLRTVTEFAVSNSFPLVVLGLALTPFVFLERVLNVAQRGVRVFTHVAYASATHMSSTVANISARSADLVAHWFIKPAVVEHYSVRCAAP